MRTPSATSPAASPAASPSGPSAPDAPVPSAPASARGSSTRNSLPLPTMLLTWNRIAGRFEVANLLEPLVQYRVGPHTMTSNHPGVAGEMAAARFGVIQAVFGADEADEWIDRHEWILPFDEGWPAHFGPREVKRSVLTVRRLHRRFIECLDVPEAERPRCHAFIRSWMSRRLVHGARRAEREGHPGLGPLLVAEAVRLEPDCVFSPNFGRYLLARLPVRR